MQSFAETCTTLWAPTYVSPNLNGRAQICASGYCWKWLKHNQTCDVISSKIGTADLSVDAKALKPAWAKCLGCVRPWIRARRFCINDSSALAGDAEEQGPSKTKDLQPANFREILSNEGRVIVADVLVASIEAQARPFRRRSTTSPRAQRLLRRYRRSSSLAR